MPVINLPFVADNSEEVIFVQCIWARISANTVDQLLRIVLTIQKVTYGKGSEEMAFALLLFPPPLTTNVV